MMPPFLLNALRWLVVRVERRSRRYRLDSRSALPPDTVQAPTRLLPTALTGLASLVHYVAEADKVTQGEDLPCDVARHLSALPTVLRNQHISETEFERVMDGHA